MGEIKKRLDLTDGYQKLLVKEQFLLPLKKWG